MKIKLGSRYRLKGLRHLRLCGLVSLLNELQMALVQIPGTYGNYGSATGVRGKISTPHCSSADDCSA